MEGQTLREDFPFLSCGMCKHFNVNADRQGFETACKRIDHKHLKFAVSCFKSYDCGQFAADICEDFFPASYVKQLYERWTDIYNYLGDWYDGRYAPGKMVYLVVDGDTSVRWGVLRSDFFHNTFLNQDGSLKWKVKKYIKQTRDGFGYKLVTEFNPECGEEEQK